MTSDVVIAWRSRIWRRHSLVLVALVAAALAVFGIVEMVVGYRAASEQAFQIQMAQAREATQAVRNALGTIDRHVTAVTALPWATFSWLSAETRREEYGRLLRLVPAIESVAFVDEHGQELLAVSRKVVDRIARAPAAAKAASSASAATSAAAITNTGTRLTSSSTIVYVHDYDPVATLKLQFPPGQAAGITVVTLGLRALARELGSALQAGDAEIFVVDRGGTVILHRDPAVILERKQLSFAKPGGDATSVAAEAAIGLNGGEVLRSVVQIDENGWRAVVEQPRALVMQPVWATLRRTAWLMAGGIVAAIGVALWLAARLTRPILELHAAAARLGAGRLDTHVEIVTGDELQAVAEQFNRMASSLKESYADLEAKVAEKTRDLERANRHLSDFMAHMSHELRTPLNAVIGMSEALQDEADYGALNDKQREYLDDINASGEHLLALINDLLDLARIEAGRAELFPEPFDVASAIANAVALLRERAHRKGVAVSTAVDPVVGVRSADPRRFKQVLVNLLTNAVKFTPAGGAVVVRAGVDAAALWVEVADTGCGIALEDQQVIFEKFRRGSAGPQTEGTGLGLSLVRELVRLHGGEVTLRSVPGAGSSFRFTVPGVSS